jgi:GntR family transcriptional regulator
MGKMVEADSLLVHLKADIDTGTNGLPLYKQLKAALEGAILDNRLKPGAVLPGERLISDALGLSRVTVRKSIAALVEEGFLRRKHGSKTEVSSRVEKSLSTLTSFSEDMSARGLEPGCVWISKQISRPSPSEMMALGIAADTYVIRMKRIRTADGLPLAIETSTVPTRFLASPELVGDSLYEALERQGALPQRAIQRMRSRPASSSDAVHLKCEVGSPLLIMERRCFLADEQIVEFSESRYKGDVYDLVFELKR